MNPIITRELIGMLRTRKALAWQVAVVAILSLLVVIRWPSDAKVNTSGEQAKEVLRVFGYGLMIAVVMLAPVFPATSIVREKQRGTLALLLNSPMSPWSILIGKLVGSMGFILLLLILSMPPAAATFTMGGVNLGQVMSVYIVLALVALQYGSIALYVSSRAGSVDSALRITFGLILSLAVIPLVLIEFVPRDQPMPFGPLAFWDYLGNVPKWAGNQKFAWLPEGLGVPVYSAILYVVVAITWVSRFFSPAPAMTAILQDEAVLGAAGGDSGGAAWRFGVVAILAAAVFLWLTARRLRPGMLDRARDAGNITDERTAAVKAYRRFMFLWFFDPQRRSGAIGTFQNPVMIKEFRTRRFGRRHWLMRLFAVCIVLSLGLMFAITEKTQGKSETVMSILVLLQVSLLLLITPALASGLISSERESGGWALLQVTPMSAVSIVVGKLMSVMVTLLLVLLATMPGYVVVLFMNSQNAATDAGIVQQILDVLFKSTSTQAVVGIQLSLLLMGVFAVLLSAASSSFFRRTATATAVSYAVLGVLCVGTMLFRLAEDAPFSHQTVEAVLTLNPLAAALTQIRAPMFTDYPSVAPTNRVIMGIGCVACLAALVWRTRQLTRPQ
jgi:ABC-type transport system involved in multi-copper enzyme maturation permease subunit